MNLVSTVIQLSLQSNGNIPILHKALSTESMALFFLLGKGRWSFVVCWLVAGPEK